MTHREREEWIAQPNTSTTTVAAAAAAVIAAAAVEDGTNERTTSPQGFFTGTDLVNKPWETYYRTWRI